MKHGIPYCFFVDAYNPTDEEVIRWAYVEGAYHPPEMEQDWELCVADPGRAELFVSLVSDTACPNRKFFLSCLYLMVGDAVRSNGAYWDLEVLAAWLGKDRPEPVSDVALFFQRAGHLLVDRNGFNYDSWCGGGHAYGIEERL